MTKSLNTDSEKITTNIKNAIKRFSKTRLIISSIILGIVIIIFLVVLVEHGTRKTVQQVEPTSSARLTASNSKDSTGLNVLYAQARPILTAADTHYENLHDKVLADATADNAAAANSELYKDKQLFDSTPDSTAITAYNTVANAFSNANITRPPALDSWSMDTEQLYTDITKWTSDQWGVAVDGIVPTDSSTVQSDIAKVTTDTTAYETDHAKVEADIALFKS